MSEILAYALGVMYSPGPVNLLGLHCGINKQTRSHLGFFAGVGIAMFILFVALGFVGKELVNPAVLPFISLVGCSYILYIAWKVLQAKVNVSLDDSKENSLSFRDGLLMQLLNPKALVATLPIATIQFPSAGISGAAIIFWSVILALLAFGAPTGYSLTGLLLGKRISDPRYFKVFNILMAGLLVYVSATIGYQYVVIPLLSV
ncbi:LysE family translocator [Vibrio brasiliensis]|uniref:LysE family translocator n=1 Tax=Vibrio brasiliensis TaxID=170652 RepID=UPI001EFC67C8|nr:LysE family transporter [Vibrio brasiliensis]MCG9725024.1 LysE family transporter [Vibrio brasiliensis]